jgi:hydroxymethylpyrimidine/phosphomethylpyrimidine kinase
VTRPLGRVLVVAGSDSGGGAGIQADLRTIARLGGYGMTAVTALTVQDTMGVSAVHLVPPDFVARQMRSALADLGADVIKIGMLANAEIVEAVAEVLESDLAAGIPVVLDPVMLSKHGVALLDGAAIDALKRRLLPRAYLVTPNIPEAEALTGLTALDAVSMGLAADALLTMGAHNVLVKGGHLAGDSLVDLLVGRDGAAEFRRPRIMSQHTHGTGCTLSSAIATALAQGETLTHAAARGVAYIEAAIRDAPGFGKGNGPLGLGPVSITEQPAAEPDAS